MTAHKSMPSAYDPQSVEPVWSRRWEEARLFKADPKSPKPKYSIAVPPPNVTGELHMGHALQHAIHDSGTEIGGNDASRRCKSA